MSQYNKKLFIFMQVKLISPLCIGNNISESTDLDVIRDYDGNPFIPASSIAGAFRAYLGKDSKAIENLFGYTKRDEKETISKKSNLILYDSYFKHKIETDIRDGIQLNQDKQTISGNKYDMEVIPSNEFFDLKMELDVGIDMEEQVLLDCLKRICFGIQEGEIRFGHKKNRGYGQSRIEAVYLKQYEKGKIENLEDSWIYFDCNKKSSTWASFMMDVTQEWLDYTSINEHTYYSIKIDLHLDGGISIRQYAGSSKEPDFSQITMRGENKTSSTKVNSFVNRIPVIPGTSWNGAIRHRCQSMLSELGLPEIKTSYMIRKMFGYVDEQEKSAESSNIIIGESQIIGSSPLVSRRTKINHFSSAPMNRQLYEELTYFTGKTSLEIKVRKTEYSDWMIGLLLLVIKDIYNGYLAIGGQTSIGRGIFSRDNDIRIDNNVQQEQMEETYLQALYSYITEEGEN